MPQLIDGSIQAGIEVDEGVRGPQKPPEIVAGDYFAMPLNKDGKNLKRAVLQLYRNPIPAQFPRD